jgi:hypothetical protein
MGIFVIPNNSPGDDSVIIPKVSAEKNCTDNAFTSLTDHFNPKDQYTRPIIQIATGEPHALDEHQERLARLIEARGEHVVLVKRKLDGEYCDCYNPVMKEVMRHWCLQCHGTRIKGGYELYKNLRREDNKIVVASPFTDYGITWEDYGRETQETNTFWTLPWIPLANGTSTFSYDFIIRYNHDGSEMGRYYIENVKPSRSVENRITYQMFKARLADRPQGSSRGDLIYHIDLTKLSVLEGTVQPDKLNRPNYMPYAQEPHKLNNPNCLPTDKCSDIK